MVDIKKLEVEFENGRILIEKWSHEGNEYETIEMFGCLDLADVEKVISIYKGGKIK